MLIPLSQNIALTLFIREGSKVVEKIAVYYITKKFIVILVITGICWEHNVMYTGKNHLKVVSPLIRVANLFTSIFTSFLWLLSRKEWIVFENKWKWLNRYHLLSF